MLQQYGPSGEKNFRFAKSVRKRLHADEFTTEWPSVLIYTTVSGVNTAILLRGEGSDECGGVGGGEGVESYTSCKSRAEECTETLREKVRTLRESER